jgi:uncharacterized protein (DUF305 family)
MGAILAGMAGIAAAQDTPIVQPGAPGQDARALSAEEAIEIANSSYSRDDVVFMQNMIPHHAQAVEMAALVAERTNNDEIKDIAGRITASQADEIEFMRGWLTERGEHAPGATEGHAGHGAHAGHGDLSEEMMLNMGMASMDQMAALAAATGTDFDRQFLTLMIRHHEGAVTMVKDLQLLPGSAYDPVLFKFTNDIVNDQTAEIERMNVLLSDLSGDARVGLAAGYDTAGEAISNLSLVASLPMPSGFFDPQNPAGLPPIIPPKEDVAEAETTEDESAAETPERTEDEQSNEGTQWGERSPLLSFSNTDMAFSGDVLVTGNYHGFNIYKLNDDGLPNLFSSVVCPGGQGDVSIVGDLLIMSVEQTRGRVDCGREGIAEDVSAERFRGIRIFDISNLAAPRQVGQVQTCRGSHTHSVVSGPGEDGKIIVYNSGTAGVRDEDELEGCIGAIPGDRRTALFRIDVIEIPVADPSQARIVDSPTVFADEETGEIAGLWAGGDHGDDTQFTAQTNQCHDITVFPKANLAAGACSGNGIIFDISNPREPKRLDAVLDTGFAYWHSATFNNDGTKVLFTDEWGGGGRPRCRAYDPKDWGADAIYNIVNGKLEFQGYYKLPAPQSDQENCVAHNGSIIPVPGRDIFAQAWYQGGLSVMDFTDSKNAIEIAYFDRGPVHEERLVLAGYWSTYWYEGKIYGTEIARGLDVFSLTPSEHLTENEIAAAALADQGALFNPQQQFAVTWPAVPVVARAYIDQLNRTDTLSGRDQRRLNRALNRADSRLAEGRKDARLAGQLDALAERLDLEGPQAARQAALAGVLTDIAAKLR